MVPDWLEALFRYHRKQRRGVIALLALLGAVIGYNLHLRSSAPQQGTGELLRFGPSIQRFARSWPHDDGHISHSGPRSGEPTAPEHAAPFPFDPNALDSAGWVQLGFSPGQVAAILRYRGRAGGFRDTAHMGRMTILAERLDELAPFIRFDPATMPAPSVGRTTGMRPSFERPAPRPKVPINTADTALLQSLPGIGPAFAGRIVRYRQRLGGFHDPGQLSEVHGMDSARLALILPRIELDPAPLRTIDINSAPVDTLGRHPYIGFKLAKVMVAYRQQHGPYTSVDGLRHIAILTEDKYQQIRPYLTAR